MLIENLRCYYLPGLIGRRMMEKGELKVQGLAFGRTLQSAFKISTMYSVDHPSAEKSLQRSYDSLNSLLQQTKEYTFGFLNQRVLLDKILTRDTTLAPLEIEFAKRDIGAVSFAAGITLPEFKRGVALLSTKPSVITENGGIKRFLDKNAVNGVRILASERPKGDDGDVTVQMDVQAYLNAQANPEPQSGTGLRGTDMLLKLGGGKKQGGYGGSAMEVLDLVGNAVSAALVDQDGDIRELVSAVARTVEELPPDYLLPTLPPEKQGELRGRSAEDVAIDLIENNAAAWSVQKLAATPPGPGAIAVEDEVVRGLLRGLQATKLAERLLQKLARLVAEAHLPAEIYDRIRQELLWLMLSPAEKSAQLLRLEKYTAQDFPRLVNFIQEIMNEGKIEEATQLANHYFEFLETAPPARRTEELARAPEVLRAVAGLKTLAFMHALAGRLWQEAPGNDQVEWSCHQRAVECLIGMTQTAALYEDFEFVQKIGLGLERSWSRDKAPHSECCGKALKVLLAPASMERLVEVFLEKHDDASWTRTVTSLLKLGGGQGAEIAYQHLEVETLAANRMRLMRLLGRLGAPAVAATRQRLADERWYVVRNACYILGDLGGSEICKIARAALRHADVRVQQAAITAIIKSQAPDRPQELAEALPYLQDPVLEMALDELSFLKDPACIPGVEQFLGRKNTAKPRVMLKALQAIAAVPSERAAKVLGAVLSDTGQALPLRNAALLALSRSPFALAGELLVQFAQSYPNDPLAADCQKVLENWRD